MWLLLPQQLSSGGVVEWLMAPVLKTGEVQASVGSNPTPSVVSADDSGDWRNRLRGASPLRVYSVTGPRLYLVVEPAEPATTVAPGFGRRLET